MTITLQPASNVATPWNLGWNKSTVADLTPDVIDHMSLDDMVSAVRAARLPWLQGERGDRLTFHNRSTLERMVYRARFVCRNQGY